MTKSRGGGPPLMWRGRPRRGRLLAERAKMTTKPDPNIEQALLAAKAEARVLASTAWI